MPLWLIEHWLIEKNLVLLLLLLFFSEKKSLCSYALKELMEICIPISPCACLCLVLSFFCACVCNLGCIHAFAVLCIVLWTVASWHVFVCVLKRKSVYFKFCLLFFSFSLLGEPSNLIWPEWSVRQILGREIISKFVTRKVPQRQVCGSRAARYCLNIKYMFLYSCILC